MRKKRYWAIRTDKGNRELLFSELQKGLLRQGWGYDEDQNLYRIQDIINEGGKWWEKLTESQNAAFHNMKMLSSDDNSIGIGDIILTPNLPKQNYFCLAEVTGPYRFERLKLTEENDINELGYDYGHILPVRLLAPHGIDKYNKYVHAGIRATLRTPMRMWNIDGYAKYINELIEKNEEGIDLTIPSSGEARLNIAWDNALTKAIDALQEELAAQLDCKFQAAEWEEPISTVMEQLYPSSNIRWTGGVNEHGADIVIEIPNYFGEIPWLIVVQVKNYTGEIGSDVLHQIREAYNHYGKEGKIISGVILTTAESRLESFDQDKRLLEKEIGIPIELILRKKLIKIMTEGLSRQMDVLTSRFT